MYLLYREQPKKSSSEPSTAERSLPSMGLDIWVRARVQGRIPVESSWVFLYLLIYYCAYSLRAVRGDFCSSKHFFYIDQIPISGLVK